jgi:hypothetical protein
MSRWAFSSSADCAGSRCVLGDRRSEGDGTAASTTDGKRRPGPSAGRGARANGACQIDGGFWSLCSLEMPCGPAVDDAVGSHQIVEPSETAILRSHVAHP